MLQIILVAFGGAVGSVLRYLTSTATYTLLGRNLPYGTLVVNCIGSLLMGFLTIILLERFGNLAAELRSLLLIGFLGGYTTFSSFSIETFNLLENGEPIRAILNVGLSLGLCLMMTWIGVIFARQL